MPNLLRLVEIVAVIALLAWVPLSLAASFLVMGQVQDGKSRLRIGFNPLGARREALTPLGWKILVAYRWYLIVGLVAGAVTIISYQLN